MQTTTRSTERPPSHSTAHPRRSSNGRIATKLLVVVGVGLLAGFFALSTSNVHQMRASVVSQNEQTVAKLTESVSKGLQTIMLAGYADIAQSYADSLKTIPDLLDFRIMRIDGTEAFRDNVTIHAVNDRAGSEEFIPRDKESTVRVLPSDQSALVNVMKTKRSVSFYTDNVQRHQTLTFLTPILNDKRCAQCHGSDHDVRGILKLTTTMQGVEEDIQRNMTVASAVSLVVACVVLIAVYILVRRISMPIVNVARNMGDIADGEGDLTVALDVKGNDEVAMLAGNFNTFSGKVREMIVRVADSAQRMREFVNGLLSASEQASDNMNKQQVDTRSVARAMAKMVERVGDVAGYAEEASAAASQADQSAKDGKQLVGGVIESIHLAGAEAKQSAELVNHLNHESLAIGTIVNTITDIAQQVNLLALNAKIEAAKAGAHGVGFAVVANEVRRLSELTRETTSQVQDKVQKLQENAHRAMTFANESSANIDGRIQQAKAAERAIDSIVRTISKINDLNARIDSAARQQRDVAAAVDRSVGNVSRLADESMDRMQKITSSNHELAGLATTLTNLVRQFKT